jgi:hypothetical protein
MASTRTLGHNCSLSKRNVEYQWYDLIILTRLNQRGKLITVIEELNDYGHDNFFYQVTTTMADENKKTWVPFYVIIYSRNWAAHAALNLDPGPWK